MIATPSNEKLERAAVAAESWQASTSELCTCTYVSEEGALSPDLAALEFQGTNLAASKNPSVAYMIDSLAKIFPSYALAIDEGRGHEVAAAFRAAKS